MSSILLLIAAGTGHPFSGLRLAGPGPGDSEAAHRASDPVSFFASDIFISSQKKGGIVFMSDFKKNKWIMDIKYTQSLYY